MIQARVLDKHGKLKWHGVLPNGIPHIRVKVFPSIEPNTDWRTSIIEADLERELPEDDGGPILIYRLSKEMIEDE